METAPDSLNGERVPFILMENSPSRFSSSASMVHIFCEEDRKLASARGFCSKQLKAHDVREAADNYSSRLEHGGHLPVCKELHGTACEAFWAKCSPRAYASLLVCGEFRTQKNKSLISMCNDEVAR